MKKLNPNIRIGEADSASDAIVRHYEAETALADDTALAEIMAEIRDLSAKITTAIKSDKVVSNLDEADRERDEAVKNLSTLLNGYAVLPAKKEQAAKLLAVFAKYGSDITRGTYEKESSDIESMLEDFAAADAAEAAKDLEGAADFIQEIRAAEDNFKAVRDSYKNATNSRGASATSLKKPLVNAVNKLVQYLNTMQLIGNKKYGSLITKCEREINDFNAGTKKNKQ